MHTWTCKFFHSSLSCTCPLLLTPEPIDPIQQDLQVSQARFPHRTRDGFDGRQHGVDQLGELSSRTLNLSSRLHDEPGQGPHVRIKHRLIRHFGVGLPETVSVGLERMCEWVSERGVSE